MVGNNNQLFIYNKVKIGSNGSGEKYLKINLLSFLIHRKCTNYINFVKSIS